MRIHRVHTSLSAPKTGRSGPRSDPAVPRQTKQWCQVTSSCPETDGWLVSEATTMAKVTSPALCAHLHPNTPVVIFIPCRTSLIGTRKHAHTQCSQEQMNHLDSAAVCHTIWPASKTSAGQPRILDGYKFWDDWEFCFASAAQWVSTHSNQSATLLR